MLGSYPVVPVPGVLWPDLQACARMQVWILTGRRQDMYRSMWVRAMDEMIKKLVHTSQDGYTYVAILSGYNAVKPLFSQYHPAPCEPAAHTLLRWAVSNTQL